MSPHTPQITQDLDSSARQDAPSASLLLVCINCKRLKRKCDRVQPTCSRCLLNGLECQYDGRRKRPGPPKGSINSRTKFLLSRVGQLEETVQVLSNQRHDLSVPGPSHLRELEVSEELSSTQVNEGLGVIPLLGSPNTTLASSDSTYESIYHTLVIGGPSRHQAVRQVLHDYDPSNLPFSFKHTLVSLYFDHIQPTFPMFRKPVFYRELMDNLIPSSLLIAMFAAACRFLSADKSHRLFGSDSAPGDQFFKLANQRFREDMDEQKNSSVTLNTVKTSCLLALYEFTSQPSRQAWILVGNAMRLALMAQLHQVDSRNNTPAENLSPAEKEERRFVWWTIWRLDCTINVTAVTPFGIDCQLIGTALVTTTVANFTAGNVEVVGTSDIPEMDPIKSWSSTRGPKLHDAGDGFNTHLFAVSLLRAVSECHQRFNTRDNPEEIRRIEDLDIIFEALHLILPQDFFTRMKSPIEDFDTHRLRLETIIMINTARLILHEPFGQFTLAWPEILATSSSQLGSLKNWKNSIGNAEDIADIFKYWQTEYFAMCDPVICCAIWHAYCGLMVFSMSGLGMDDDARENNAPEGLILSLDNFTPWWPIARTLRDSIQELQAWSWAKLDTERLVDFISHIRKAFSPHSKNPGWVDVSLLCDSLFQDGLEGMYNLGN